MLRGELIWDEPWSRVLCIIAIQVIDIFNLKKKNPKIDGLITFI